MTGKKVNSGLGQNSMGKKKSAFVNSDIRKSELIN